MAGALNAMPELAFVLAMDVLAQIDSAAGSLASLLYDATAARGAWWMPPAAWHRGR